MPTPDATTTPIPDPTRPGPPPGRYASPNPAPNTPTECPRCGAPAISREGVAKHELDHRRRDVLEKRTEKVLDALEEMLSVFATPDPETGERRTFRSWVIDTDDILDVHNAALRPVIELDDGADRLAALLAAGPADAPAPATFGTVPWPDDEELAAAEPDDRADALAELVGHAPANPEPRPLAGYDVEPGPDEPGSVAPIAHRFEGGPDIPRWGSDTSLTDDGIDDF